MLKFLTPSSVIAVAISTLMLCYPPAPVYAEENFVSSISPSSVMEGENVVLTIVRFDASEEASYRVSTLPATANPGVDYEEIDRTFIFPRGKTMHTETIKTVGSPTVQPARSFSIGVCAGSDCVEAKMQFMKAWILDSKSNFNARTPSSVLERDSLSSPDTPPPAGRPGYLPCGYVWNKETNGMMWDQQTAKSDCGWKYVAVLLRGVIGYILLPIAFIAFLVNALLFLRKKKTAEVTDVSAQVSRHGVWLAVALLLSIFLAGACVFISYALGYESLGASLSSIL